MAKKIKQEIYKFFEQNTAALAEFIETFPNIHEEFERNPRDAAFYLRNTCGFVCAKCGKPIITTDILKGTHFSPNTICLDCVKQNI